MTHEFDEVAASQRQQVCTALWQTALCDEFLAEFRPHQPLLVIGRLMHDTLLERYGAHVVTRFFTTLFPRFPELGLGPLQSSFVHVRSLEQAVLGGVAREVLSPQCSGTEDVEARVLQGARRGFAQYLEDAREQRLLSRSLYQSLLSVAGLEAPGLTPPRFVM